MTKRRGFFAELQHQTQIAEKRNRQQKAAAEREHTRLVAQAERALREAERAQVAAQKATAADRKAADVEALRLHREARRAEVDALNADLVSIRAELGSILAGTLEVDDFVDLNALRIFATHLPFEAPADIAFPIPEIVGPFRPPEPLLVEPPPSKGLAGLIGGKRRHEEALKAARGEHERALGAWREATAGIEAAFEADKVARVDAENRRLAQFASARAAYDATCVEREAEVSYQNERLDKLIGELAFDVPEAIVEYIGIVLSNSVYPECFPIEHDFTFDLESRELTLKVVAPSPSTIATVKEYKYVQAKDEITETTVPAKELKDRYASAIAQTAVRSMHEIFESDRAGKIHTIALTIVVGRLDPGTGLDVESPLVAVAADRSTFASFDLANVVPSATLQHLGGLISKSPFDLIAVDMSKGVRRR